MIKTLLSVLFLFMTLPGFAQEFIESDYISINGRGSANGYCDGSNYWCLDSVKQNARRYAEDDARWQCQSKRGNLQGFGNCFDHCNPPFLNPGSPAQFVSCHADCSFRCEIPNTPIATE